MSPDPASLGADARALLKGGAALGVVGASFVQGTAAEAGNKAQKEQAEALKAAAAARSAVSQPAAASSADHYGRAKLLLAGGDVPGAMAAFRRVLAEEPRSVDAMNGLGVTYDRMGRHDVARGWYEAALSVAPDDGAVLANLGYSLTLQDEWRAAIPWLQAASRSSDAQAVQTARRLLVRVNAALTAQRARAPVFARPVEIALSVPAPAAVAVSGPAMLALGAAPAAVAVAVVAGVPAAAGMAAPAGARAVAMVEGEASGGASPVGTHIELAANGEAQLVFGSARAPTPALVASLGDAATLVLAPMALRVVRDAGISAPVVMLADAAPDAVAGGRTRTARARDVQAKDRLDGRAQFRQALVMVEAPIAQLSLDGGAELALIPALVAARAADDALLVDAPIAPMLAGVADRPAIVRQAVARIEAASLAPRADVGAGASGFGDSGSGESGAGASAFGADVGAPVDVMRFALAPEVLGRGAASPPPVLSALAPHVGPDGLAFGPALDNPDGPDANPAWLLHIRRAGPDGRSAPSAPALALSAADAPGARQFDSDDNDLNQFAARLRGPGVPGADGRSPAARQAAIARLEAVISRVRAG